MPVSSTHPEYKRFSFDWKKCRDCYEGQSFIKEMGTAYLPLLSSHLSDRDEEYIKYIHRASFLNAMRRTIQGLIGMMFSKSPVYSEGFDFGDLHRKSIEFSTEIHKVGRCGILIDSDESGKAKYVIYSAESIINWKENQFIVLRETLDVQNQGDPFTFTKKNQYRVLRFNENGHYVQEVMDESDKVIEPEKLIIVQDEPLYKFPFFICNVTHKGMSVESPPMIDLVSVNISHYNNSADYENGLHHTALPTALFLGFTEDDVASCGGKIRLGSTTGIVARDPSANGKYLEFTGAGLSQIRDAMQDKQAQMAALGARMLSPEKLAVETADSQMIKRTGEVSSLSNIANMISETLTEAAQMYLKWNGYKNYESFYYQINTDYNPSGLSYQEIQALVGAWQAGAISMDVLFYNLKQGQIIKDDLSLEDMLSDIEFDNASRSMSTTESINSINNDQGVI